jgi:hypothetical protein
MEKYLESIDGYAKMDAKALEQKKALLHKLSLLHQLVLHGYDDTAKHRDEMDVKFLNQIRNLDFYTLKLNIERELYALHG